MLNNLSNSFKKHIPNTKLEFKNLLRFHKSNKHKYKLQTSITKFIIQSINFGKERKNIYVKLNQSRYTTELINKLRQFKKIRKYCEDVSKIKSKKDGKA